MADDLVQRLRLRAQPWRGGLHMPDKVVEVVEAADRIEELEADRAELMKNIAGYREASSRLKFRIEELEAALGAFLDAAQYDVLMEGPKLKGWNRSGLDRALVKARRAL